MVLRLTIYAVYTLWQGNFRITIPEYSTSEQNILQSVFTLICSVSTKVNFCICISDNVQKSVAKKVLPESSISFESWHRRNISPFGFTSSLIV